MYPPPPPYYAKLENQYSTSHPGGPYASSTYHRNVPRYPSHYHKRSSGSSCLRCICCCCCFILFLIITLVIIFMTLYNIYDPKIPEYKIEGLEVKSFKILPDSSLSTEFQVNVKVDNPNKRIGFKYGHDSYIDVLYSDTSLCSGKLPTFLQGHENTTVMKIPLKGKSEFGSGLQKAFSDSRKNHKIPVDINVKVPVSIVVGEVATLREFKIFVNCHLMLDNLSPDSKVGIISKDTRFRLEL